MTISSKAQSRKKNSAQKLHLSGSQINLSPRPIPISHITWSSSYCSYPMRRSVSAFGFQQDQEVDDGGHCLKNRGGGSAGRSRPLSADNIRYMTRVNFADDYHNEITISSRSQSKEEDFAKGCTLSENVYENILNGYSESKQMEYHEKAQTKPINNLKPGLSSKPPLPPSADNVKCHLSFNNTSEIQSQGQAETENSVQSDENLKTVAEREAFDEIIALKFQRWFPNTISNNHNEKYDHTLDSGSEDDGGGGGEMDDIEFLSYKERNYKTYEYRYEVLRKDNITKIKTKGETKTKTKVGSCDKGTTKNPLKKAPSLKYKVNLTAPASMNTSASATGSVQPSNDSFNHTKMSDDPTRYKNEKFTSCQSSNSDIEQDSLALMNRVTINRLQEGNCKNSIDKADENIKKLKNITTAPAVSAVPEMYSKPSLKLQKISSFKKSNLQSPSASPSKKAKKISFSTDNLTDMVKGKTDDGDDENNNDTKENDDFVETYFATKNSLASSQMKTEDDEKSTGHQLPASDVLKKDRNATSSPQQPVGSQIDDVLSWMCTHRGVDAQSDVNYKMGLMSEVEANSSMYEEMIDILKDIENEEIRKDDSKATEAVIIPTTPSSPAKAIWSLIEEAEKNHDTIESAKYNEEPIYNQSCKSDISLNNRQSLSNAQETNWNRLSDLLRLSSTDLAQKAMSLQLLMEDRETALQNLNVRLKTIEQTHQDQVQQYEYSIQKQRKLIEQLKIDKKSISEKMQNTISELEKKHAAALIALDEKHKIELKKSLEKQAAADKLERDRWIETKAQKIRDLTMKGLEPELNRMTAAHQKEIAELHKFYKEKAQDAEEVTNRRMAVQKEKLEAEKEKALAVERELSRQKLADEIGELEKRYQDQRKRLLAEVHVERENMERESEATLAIKEKDNERKWEKKSVEMQKKIEALNNQHQEEMKKMQQNFDSEKQIWMKNQILELSDKENKIREQCRKERDKHIELIVQKLENENTEREMASEQKIKKMKDKYETEIGDLEVVNENLKRKCNESRNEIGKIEETVSQLRAQLNQSQTEYVILKEKYERLITEQGEMQNVAKSELTTRIHILQSELSQAQLTYESQIKTLKSENDRQLSQMYNKVKEMIDKKDYVIKTLNQQKDAALKQCNQLEELLQLKRKDRPIIN